MNDIKRTFVKRGSVVEVVSNIPKEEITPKDMIETLNRFRNAITQAEEQLKKFDAQKKQVTESIEKHAAMVKDLVKFEEWALEVQKSKLKGYVDQFLEEAKSKIDSEYIVDNTQDLDYNNRQKYMQIQRAIATNKEVAENIAKEVITEDLFVNCIFENPWK